MTEESDDPVLLRCALVDGDGAAWRLLYQRHTPSLYRLARHLSDSSTDADDLVNEVWLRAARSVGRFEGRSRLRTWLTGILLNCVREWRRVGHRLVEEPLPEDLAAPEAEPPMGIERLDLERALGRLASGYREVLLLHDVEGYTHQEIAAFLGVDAGTSKSQLTRARRALARALRI